MYSANSSLWEILQDKQPDFVNKLQGKEGTFLD